MRFLLLLGFLIVGIGCGKSPVPKPAPPSIQITAKALIDEYKANELAADAKFKGKTLSVTGWLDADYNNVSRTWDVWLKPDQSPRDMFDSSIIYCRFPVPKSGHGGADKLVVVQGVCGGSVSGRLELLDCDITETKYKETDQFAKAERDRKAKHLEQLETFVLTREPMKLTVLEMRGKDKTGSKWRDDFRKQVVEVTGIVQSVRRTKESSLYGEDNLLVELGDKDDGECVRCYFHLTSGREKEMATIRKGQTVKIRGQCDDNPWSLRFCSFSK